MSGQHLTGGFQNENHGPLWRTVLCTVPTSSVSRTGYRDTDQYRTAALRLSRCCRGISGATTTDQRQARRDRKPLAMMCHVVTCHIYPLGGELAQRARLTTILCEHLTRSDMKGGVAMPILEYL
jgi:hypothetical protein